MEELDSERGASTGGFTTTLVPDNIYIASTQEIRKGTTISAGQHILWIDSFLTFSGEVFSCIMRRSPTRYRVDGTWFRKPDTLV